VSTPLERTWAPFSACPCGACSVVSAKLSVRTGHVRGCACSSCRNRRNRAKGHAAQAKAHRALGGKGFTPSNEESARPYEVTVAILPESKTGSQIPAAWDRFVATDWFRGALSQSERACPVGTGVLPAVVLRGDWVVVDIRRKRHNG
jgi:hypothetical protein